MYVPSVPRLHFSHSLGGFGNESDGQCHGGNIELVVGVREGLGVSNAKRRTRRGCSASSIGDPILRGINGADLFGPTPVND
jgi:hypothetical protein